MAPEPVNIELIRARAADMRREMVALRSYADLPEGEFLTGLERTRAARYSLIVVVEAAAAICNHLSTRRGEVPDSYPGCFELLGRLGVLDGGLAARLVALARLRNLLVHGYARVDDAQIHRSIRQGLSDLDAYLSAVESEIAPLSPPESL